MFFILYNEIRIQFGRYCKERIFLRFLLFTSYFFPFIFFPFFNFHFDVERCSQSWLKRKDDTALCSSNVKRVFPLFFRLSRFHWKLSNQGFYVLFCVCCCSSNSVSVTCLEKLFYFVVTQVETVLFQIVDCSIRERATNISTSTTFPKPSGVDCSLMSNACSFVHCRCDSSMPRSNRCWALDVRNRTLTWRWVLTMVCTTIYAYESYTIQ